MDSRIVSRRLRLLERIGSGGVGEVWSAEDLQNGRKLALKCMRPGRDRHRDRLALRREFHTLAGLRHPNIVDVHEFDSDGGFAYYTMELLSGPELRALAPLDWRQACSLLRDVTDALAYLHSRRLIHRDVTPRNVRLDDSGRARLIDFGLLATVGFTGRVSGTPPFIAPEAVRGAPLDQTVDLFSIGALAYWLLTGSHAYPAKRIEELSDAWSRRPPPPSSLVPGIPPALDALVEHLLALNASERPSQAAEVIEHFETIASLPPGSPEQSQSYLVNADLVGRERELFDLGGRVEACAQGRGGAIVIESPAGLGKSRLLRELGLYAQLAGPLVVHIDAAETPGPWQCIQKLGRAVVDMLGPNPPEELRSMPRLLHAADATPSVAQAMQERSRAQKVFLRWLVQVAAHRPLVIAIDSIEACDELSAAVLVQVAQEAREHPLLLALALRSEAETAPAVEALVRVSDRTKLEGLNPSELANLLRSMLGPFQGEERLVPWIDAAAGGNPQHIIELVQHLIQQGFLCYRAGQWILMEGLEDVAPLDTLESSFDRRVAVLSPVARKLGQLVALMDDTFSLWMAVAVTDTDEEDAFSAIDELAQEGFFVGTADHYAIRHQGLRNALLRSIPASERKALHLRVAQTLTSEGDPPPDLAANAGWHYLRGGEELRGAELLEQAGRYYYRRIAFGAALEPLKTALEIFERRGGNEARCLKLRRMLVTAAAQADLDVVVRYGLESFEMAWRYAGLPLATALPIRPRVAQLSAGIGATQLAWALTPKARRGPSPRAAVVTTLQLGVVSAVTYYGMGHADQLRALLDRMRPIAALHKASAGYEICRALYCDLTGDHQGSSDAVDRAWRALDSAAGEISSADLRSARAVLLFMRGFRLLLLQDPEFERFFGLLEAMAPDTYLLGTSIGRALWHRTRGEEEVALKLLAEVQPVRDRIGTVWTLNGIVSRSSTWGYCLTGDLLGLRRAVEQIGHQVAHGYHYTPFRNLAEGMLLRETGDLAGAETLLHSVSEAVLPGGIASYARVALAEVLVAQGRTEEAIRVANLVRSETAQWRPARRSIGVRACVPLALARAQAGRTDEAAAILEAGIADATESPTVVGFLCEARARVAAIAGDESAFDRFFDETARWFQPTANPVLLGRLQRLRSLRRVTVDEQRDDRRLEAAMTTFADFPTTMDKTQVLQPTEVEQVTVEVFSGGKA